MTPEAAQTLVEIKERHESDEAHFIKYGESYDSHRTDEHDDRIRLLSIIECLLKTIDEYAAEFESERAAKTLAVDALSTATDLMRSQTKEIERLNRSRSNNEELGGWG